MKTVICLTIFLAVPISQAAVWVSGSNVVNQHGVYGEKNVPSPDNMPGSRRESMSWTDAAGNFWLFGGWRFEGGYLNDLWKFDGANWTWVGGDIYGNMPGVYGVQGVPDSDNMPGARGSAAVWKDSRGNVWLFGGSGYAARRVWGVLNDFWRFDGTYWTWMGGSPNYLPQAGTYGTRGEADVDNMPGSRYGAVSWVDSDDNLWLFGGYGYDAYGQFGWLNDLWKYDGSGWAWITGPILVNQPAFYGTRGQAAPENVPGPRWGAVGWMDPKNNLWLFGGAAAPGRNFNDLWVFNGTEWAWVNGSDLINQPGFYGEKGVVLPANVPGARDHSISWTDRDGNLWLFGGWNLAGYFNDLWKFDGINWMWVDGSSSPDDAGLYGQAADAIPPARWAAAGWIDAGNNLWLFGGWNRSGYYNDLWNFPNPAKIAGQNFTTLESYALAWVNSTGTDARRNKIRFDDFVTLAAYWCQQSENDFCIHE